MPVVIRTLFAPPFCSSAQVRRKNRRTPRPSKSRSACRADCRQKPHPPKVHLTSRAPRTLGDDHRHLPNFVPALRHDPAPTCWWFRRPHRWMARRRRPAGAGRPLRHAALQDAAQREQAVQEGTARLSGTPRVIRIAFVGQQRRRRHRVARARSRPARDVRAKRSTAPRAWRCGRTR